MKKLSSIPKIAYIYLLIISLFLALPLWGNHIITTLSDEIRHKTNVIIDAGHGGIDSGAVSCTGIYESQINLQISRKLEDLLHLIGVSTTMIRETDCSVATEGNTIAAKKVSDIKNRIQIANTTPNALLVSIHQNTFSDSRYSGAQIFYNSQKGSKDLAKFLQETFQSTLNPHNNRQIKQSSGVYLMEHINCIGVLVECGFISNRQEEALLRNNTYQNAISCVIATTISQYLNT